MRIGIIGAGVAGLTLARTLSVRGIDYELYDSMPALKTIGAGVSIGPRVLTQVDSDVIEVIRRSGSPMSETVVAGSNGKIYYTGVWPQPTLNAQPGWSLRRSDLQQALLSDDVRDRLRIGERCVGYDQNDSTAEVLFESGNRRTFDLLIAGDGIWSRASAHIDPDQRVLQHASMAYREIVAVDDELLAQFEGEASPRLWVGPDTNFLCYPVDSGRSIYATAYVALDPDVARRSYAGVNLVSDLRRHFHGWPTAVTSVIDRMRSPILKPIAYRSTPQRLRSGRIVALGDAIGAMCSHSAQGANTALDTALGLGRSIAEIDSQAQIPDMLATFEHAVLPRIAFVHRYATSIADVYHDAFAGDIAAKVNAIRQAVTDSRLSTTAVVA